MTPRFSYIIATRNDEYVPGCMDRLYNTLQVICRHGGPTEVVTVDWGSDRPAGLAMADRNIRGSEGRLRFVYVPKEITGRYPQFTDAVALNVALRHARGQWIGRIDQDTFPGGYFHRWMKHVLFLREWFLTASCFSGRRDLPPGETNANDAAPVNQDGVREGQPFFRCAVGIVLSHCSTWNKVRGWDENRWARGHTEHDLFVRMMNCGPTLNIGLDLNWDFYHQWHERPEGKIENKPESPEECAERLRGIVSVNGENWGLLGEEHRFTEMSL